MVRLHRSTPRSFRDWEKPVASLARPGGNLTGISEMTTDLMSKRLELLSEVVPRATVIALLVNPTNANAKPYLGEVEKAGRTKSVHLPILTASNESEVDDAFGALVQLHAGALMVPDAFFSSRGQQLVALASHHAVPAIYHLRELAAAEVLSATERALPLTVAKPAFMPDAFSRAPTRPTCRSSSRPNSSWSST